MGGRRGFSPAEAELHFTGWRRKRREAAHQSAVAALPWPRQNVNPDAFISRPTAASWIITCSTAPATVAAHSFSLAAFRASCFEWRMRTSGILSSVYRQKKKRRNNPVVFFYVNKINHRHSVLATEIKSEAVTWGAPQMNDSHYCK